MNEKEKMKRMAAKEQTSGKEERIKKRKEEEEEGEKEEEEGSRRDRREGWDAVLDSGDLIGTMQEKEKEWRRKERKKRR